MAFCMKCSREVPDLTIECPHCGHDFLGGTPPDSSRGWEYSGLADMILLVGAAASALASVVLGIVLLAVLGSLFFSKSDWRGLLQDAGAVSLGLCMALANLVVFLRVANLSERDSRSR